MDPLSPTGQGVGGIGVVSLRLDGLAGISPTGGYGAEGELVLVRAAAAAAATVAQSSAVPFVQRVLSGRGWAQEPLRFAGTRLLLNLDTAGKPPPCC